MRTKSRSCFVLGLARRHRRPIPPGSHRCGASEGRSLGTLNSGYHAMITFRLRCLLFLLCWPVALFALVLYPIVWLILLPFPNRGDRSGRRAGVD